jgi:hypothetical protein
MTNAIGGRPKRPHPLSQRTCRELLVDLHTRARAGDVAAAEALIRLAIAKRNEATLKRLARAA